MMLQDNATAKVNSDDWMPVRADEKIMIGLQVICIPCKFDENISALCLTKLFV